MKPRMNLKAAIAAAARIAGGSFLGIAALSLAVPAHAQYNQKIGNDLGKCSAGAGPAVKINLTNVKSSSGKIRVQLYRATKGDWLQSGRWLNRIEIPARADTMTVCMPAPGPGSYGIAVRHDVNNNGKTDLTQDGGGMSNNPSINIFNLGRPSYDKVAFSLANEVKAMTIRMRYL